MWRGGERVFKVSQSNSVPASTELPNFRLKYDETDYSYFFSFSPGPEDFRFFRERRCVAENTFFPFSPPPPLGANWTGKGANLLFPRCSLSRPPPVYSKIYRPPPPPLRHPKQHVKKGEKRKLLLSPEIASQKYFHLKNYPPPHTVCAHSPP